MSSLLELDIVSAEAAIFKGKVRYLIITGSQGELGIHPGHTALLTSLKPGQIKVAMENDEENIFYVSGGILEVQPTMVTVLAETALRAQDLDAAAATAAKEHAEQALDQQQAGLEYSKALTELAEAVAQLRAIKELNKQISGSRH